MHTPAKINGLTKINAILMPSLIFLLTTTKKNKSINLFSIDFFVLFYSKHFVKSICLLKYIFYN
jgi:hypothetical protein